MAAHLDGRGSDRRRRPMERGLRRIMTPSGSDRAGSTMSDARPTGSGYVGRSRQRRSARGCARLRSHRDVRKPRSHRRGGGDVGPLLAAVASPRRPEAGALDRSGWRAAPLLAHARRQAVTPGAPLSGPITVISPRARSGTEPALQKVYDDFKAQNPGSSGTSGRSRAAAPNGIGWREPRSRPASPSGS